MGTFQTTLARTAAICHIHHPSNGYGSCVLSSGRPRRDCSCAGRCLANMCGQYECPANLPGYTGPAQSQPLQPRITNHNNVLHSPLRIANRTSNGRSSFQVLQFSDEQAQQRVLKAYAAQRKRRLAQGAPAPPAAASASAPAAPAAPAARQPDALAQPDTQVASVASIASHRPLYDTLSYALQPLWRDICEPAFERYRQAFTAKAAMVSITAAARHTPLQATRTSSHPPHVQASTAEGQRLAGTASARPAA